MKKTVEISRGKNWPVCVEVVKNGKGRVVKQRTIQIPKHSQVKRD